MSTQPIGQSNRIGIQVSVIIPSYKPQDYLWQCLDSLGNQTLPKELFEVVLILNGCKEPYHEQILNYFRQQPALKVNYIQTNQGGVSNARNIGLDNAQGEYITFLDDDDYVSPNYLEELFNVSSESVIGVARPIAFTEGVNTSQPYPQTAVFDKYYPSEKISYLKIRRFFSGPCMKLFHRNMIGNRRFDTTFTLGEDGLFMFAISDSFSKCTLANNAAIYFRRYRQGSLVVTTKGTFKRKNNVRLIGAMSSIYFKGVTKYSLKFYCLQILSCIRGMFVR